MANAIFDVENALKRAFDVLRLTEDSLPTLPKGDTRDGQLGRWKRQLPESVSEIRQAKPIIS